MVEYGHVLNVGLIQALDAFYKKHGMSAGRVSGVVKEHNQAGNWQKLRYFGLVEKFSSQEAARKKGMWRVTGLGREFLEGRAKIPLKVWTSQARVIRYEDKRVNVGEVCDGYKYRVDYAIESRPVAGAEIQADLFEASV